MHTRVVVYVAGALVLLAVAGVVAWRLLGASTPYEQAMGTLPQATLRATYTSWALVREEAKGTSLDAGSSEEEVSEFLDRAYDLDLTGGSGIASSTSALAELYGFSPLDAEWEALGQSRDGQVDVLRMSDDVDMAGIERALRRLGYEAPGSGSGTGGTWRGGQDLVAKTSDDLTPLQQYVVVLPDQRLVLMSDNVDYAGRAAKVAKGDAESLTSDDGVRSLARAAEEPAAALQWTDSFVCEDLAMGSADAEDQEIADDLIAEAGEISPVEGFVMAQQADRSLIVGLHFETPEQASSNLQTRVDLASGDAPGQGGTFAERFSVTSGSADDQDVVLRLEPKGDQPVLSDFSSGPVLFATC